MLFFFVLPLILKHRLVALGFLGGGFRAGGGALKSSWQLFSNEQPSLMPFTSSTIKEDNWLQNPCEIKID